MQHPKLEFEDFILSIKDFTKEHDLYFADGIYIGIVSPPTSTSRLRFGILSWIFWWLKEFICTHFNGSLNRNSKSNINCDYLFYSLPTPAHENTLSSIATNFSGTELNLTAANINDPEVWIGNDFKQAHYSFNERFTASTLIRALLLTFRWNRMIRKDGGLFDQYRIFSSMVDAAHRYYSQSGRFDHGPRLGLIVSYELDPVVKDLVRATLTHGGRVVHVMHGQRLPHFQITKATDLILFSKIDEPWFRSRIPADVRIWTIGHPRLEATRQAVGPWTREPDNRQPRIAYFSQPVEGNYTREERKHDWRILSGLADLAEVRIRLHPRENKEQALKDLSELRANFVQLSEEGLINDLTWCDAVASSWSTVSMEAASCDRGVFWTCSEPEKYPQSAELREQGIGVLVQSPNDWKQWLDSWPVSGFEAPIRVTESQLHALGMIGDMEKSWMERLGLDSAETQETNTNHNS